MIKPFGVLLVLGFVLALFLCLITALLRVVHSVRSRARKRAAVQGIGAVVIAMFAAWTIYAVAPKGARTIAELRLPDGHAFVVRHYRYGWFEYPKVRFYARDTQGVWSSFMVISELVNPNSISLALDASSQEVRVPGVGWYRILDNDFVNPGGSRATTSQLPLGIELGEEDVY